MSGEGFTYTAPAGWTIVKQGNSSAAVDGSVNRYEVLRFELEKPYRPALYAAVSRELDGVANRLATQLSGHVAARSTIDVHGRKSRSYWIKYGNVTEQIAFVLDGQTEYEVLCRRPSSLPAASCRQLFSSFALS